MNHEFCASPDGNEIESRYANFFKVGHNAVEFLLDFGQFYSESAKEQIHTRIVMNPVYAKVLFDVLRDSIVQYEQNFGTIPHEDT